MSYRTITRRVLVDIYWHAGGYGHATKVRFNGNQVWVGDHLYQYDDIAMTPMNRALRVMSHYEQRNTNHWAYRLAQRIANGLLIGKPINERA